CQQGNNWPWTF
nr:immunoglobulin light chain junction region [Macaca mulatta]MOW08349.1 immunoglobulin light chain junction region [Macaca mulatta]MOW08356.1 immunoglobulin light chain junction region [Macaca mulatta]MOW09418.1 immunoglobulin light chain junction region [Macaca mulatta]MOW09886.1 immunoglobulin light chain junction region [Macaca mulatta]